jgi:hypothetical protein
MQKAWESERVVETHNEWLGISSDLLHSSLRFGSFCRMFANCARRHALALLPAPWVRPCRFTGAAMEQCRRRALRACVDAAAAELATLRASTRSAVQMLRKRCGRTASISPPRRLIVLAAACCLLDVDVCVVVLVTRVLWKSWKHGRCLSHEALAALLESIRADANMAEAARVALAGRGGARLLLRLGRLVAEARLAMWLVTVNSQGVAVSTAQLVARLRMLWPPAARGWQCEAFLARVRQWPRRRKAYAKTFRARWGVSWRRLPSRANLDTEDLLFRVLCGQLFVPKWVPLSGAIFGTLFWGRVN